MVSHGIVLPWELREEWAVRTRYGRVKLVLLLPGLVFTWVAVGLFLACCAALLAFVYLFVETLLSIADHWPSTYRRD